MKLFLKPHKGIKHKHLQLYIDEFLFRQSFVKKNDQESALEVYAKAIGWFYVPEMEGKQM